MASAASGNIFGVVSHFLHNDLFYTTYNDTWRLEKTKPFLTEMKAGFVHEQIYALTNPKGAVVSGLSTSATLKATVAKNRAQIDTWLSIYDGMGIKVYLTIMAYPTKVANSAVLNGQFADFIADLVVKHPSIKVVQLHNEPNLPVFWSSTPQDYVDVYRPIAATIKSKKPAVEISVGGMSSLTWGPAQNWLKAMAAAGGLDFADAVSVHPYNNTSPPEADPHFKLLSSLDPNNRAAAVEAFDQLLLELAPHRRFKLYLAEFGYSTAPTGLAAVGSEPVQSAYLARLMLIYFDLVLRGSPIEAVFWYDLKDDGADPLNLQHNFGLLTHDLQRRKPSFTAFKAVASYLGNVKDFRKLALTATSSSYPAAVDAFVWQRVSDQAIVVPHWRLAKIAPLADFSAVLTIPLPPGVKPTGVRRLDTATGAWKTLSYKVASGAVTVDARISANPNWIEVKVAPVASP